MTDMKFKENCGVDPVTLGKGYTALDDNTPFTGESITAPEHVENEKRMAKMAKEYGWPDEETSEVGFLERDMPAPYDRPNRSEVEDRG